MTSSLWLCCLGVSIGGILMMTLSGLLAMWLFATAQSLSISSLVAFRELGELPSNFEQYILCLNNIKMLKGMRCQWTCELYTTCPFLGKKSLYAIQNFRATYSSLWAWSFESYTFETSWHQNIVDKSFKEIS